MRHGKKPTRKQKVRLGQCGLSPENWLVLKQKRNGELVILHKHTDRVRVLPAEAQTAARVNPTINKAALDLDIRARAEYKEALETWSDLPEYVYTEAYYRAFMAWMRKMIHAGREDVKTLVLYALDHETGGKRPYFNFPRGGQQA